MRVQVTVTLDVDPEAWASVYGLESTRAVRDDVKEWAFHLLHAAARDNGVLK